MFHSHMRFYVTQWSGTRFYGSLIVCNRPLPLKKVTPWQPSENHLLAILVLFEIRLPANPNEPPWQILRPPWITPSSICLILHIPRKPNSLIALLFIQNNSQCQKIAKTCLPASMLSSSSIVYVQVCPAPQIFSIQQMSPSKLSSCCFCHVFSYYFAQFLLLKRVKCPPFLFSQPKQLNLVPRSSRLIGALTRRRLHF